MLQALLKSKEPDTAAEASGSGVVVVGAPDLVEALRSVRAGVEDASDRGPREAVLAAGFGPLILEASHPSAGEIIQIVADSRPDAPLLLLGDALPSAAVRAMLRLERSDVLPSATEPAEVLQFADALASREASAPADGASKCWAFLGAVGGAGATTLAIETAYALAQLGSPKGVCLVDLNLADGMTTSYLDGASKLDLPSLCANPDRLDENLMAAWCWRHEAGFSVLSAPRDPDAEQTATEAGVLSLLDLVCSTFSHVIVDMPRHRLPWSKMVLGAVDEALVASELTVPSLHAAADVCRDIDRSRERGEPAKLILNRMVAKRQRRGGFSIEQAEKAIDRKIFATVSSDWFSAREAVNLGIPVAVAKAKSPLVVDVTALAERLDPAIAQAKQRKKAK